MAMYIPSSRRRRRIVLASLASLAVGIAVGAIAGRASTPTIAEQVATARADARALAAGLRVIVLHDEAGLANGQADTGSALVLQRTRTGLDRLFHEAPWLSKARRDELTAQLDALERDQPNTASSGQAAGALADAIEAATG